jgi:hypothetical protein
VINSLVDALLLKKIAATIGLTYKSDSMFVLRLLPFKNTHYKSPPFHFRNTVSNMTPLVTVEDHPLNKFAVNQIKHVQGTIKASPRPV